MHKRLGIGVAIAMASLPALAQQLPAVKLVTAPLVAPTTAWDYYDTKGTGRTTTPLSWTPGTRPAEIKELARALGAGRYANDVYARHAYQYVRNNIETDFRFGLSKGALGAIVDQTGTAFDQAHLLVELLREGGISAEYKIGTIKLQRVDFEDWVGISNARAACQYLANGAIPARVNQQTSCGAIGASATLTNNQSPAQGGYAVEMGHVWVVANVPGATVYDPAYKRRTLKVAPAGFDLPTQLGCGTSCGTTVLGSVPGMTSWPNTSGTVQYVAGVATTQTNIENTVRSYTQSLETWIKNYNSQNLVNLQVEDLLGGRIINQDAPDTVAATHPFQAIAQYTVSGDLPDAFRTTLRVQFDNINQTLFADEIYGKRVAVWGQSYIQYTGARQVALYVGYRVLQKSTYPGSTIFNDVLTLEVRHPYSTNNGEYAHEIQVQQTEMTGCPDYGLLGTCTDYGDLFQWPTTVLHGWGPATESTVDYAAGILKRDQAGTTFENPSDPNHIFMVRNRGTQNNPVLGNAMQCWEYTQAMPDTIPDPGCYNPQQQHMAAKWLAEMSAALKIVAGTNKVFDQHHHSLGSMTSGSAYGGLSVSVETTISGVSGTNSAADRKAYFTGAAAVMAGLESSVVYQQANGVDAKSAIDSFIDANSQSRRLVRVTSANVQRVTSPTSGQSAILESYPAEEITQIQAYVAAGHELVIPHRYNGAKLAINGTTNTIDRIAYLKGILKGTNGYGADLLKDAIDSAKIRDRSTKSRQAVKVGLADGKVSLTPPADLETGYGGFPTSLAFERAYVGAGSDSPCTWIPGADWSEADFGTYLGGNPCGLGGGDQQPVAPTGRIASFSPIGGGWTHNFNINATVASNAFISLGNRSALAAARTLAAAQTLRALNTGTLTHRSNIATVFVTNWWARSLFDNIVIVSRGPQANVFARLANGVSFEPDVGSSEILTQTNQAVRIPNTPYWDRSALTFTLRLADGSILNFNYGYGGPEVTKLGESIFKPTTWTFPTGVVVTFGYKAQSYGNCLSSVSNNLGRRLNFDPDSCDTWWGGQNGISWVEDENGRRVSLRTVHNSALASFMYLNSNENYANGIPLEKMIVRLPDNTETTYEYTPAPGSSLERSYVGLRKWITPGGDSAHPYAELEFDTLYRPKSLSIGEGSEKTLFYIASINGERFRRGESARLLDPNSAAAGASMATGYFDQFGRPTLSIDPLNRCQFRRYDSFHRVVREYAADNFDANCQWLPLENGIPAGQWSVLTYDARHNLTSTTKKATRGSGLADIVTTTTYMEGVNVTECTSMATCNKPYQVTDARQYVTTYTWNPTGQLASVDSPNVPEGTPRISFGYTDLSADNGTYVSFLTSQTERTQQSPTIKNIVTAYEYRPLLQKRVLDTATVDSGGLNFVTTLGFDQVGNLISLDGPRNVADVTSYSYDSQRRLTRIDAPLGEVTRYTYTVDGQISSERKAIVDAALLVDADRTNPRPNDLVDAQWMTVRRTYYPTGDVHQVIDAHGSVTTNEFDALGRLEYVTDPVDSATSRVTRYVYDLAGQKLEEYRGWNTPGQIRYGRWNYTRTGKIDFIEDGVKSATPGQLTTAAGARTDMVYDGHDRHYQAKFPDPATGQPNDSDYQEYGYDANGNLTSKRNRSGITVTVQYDAMNRERTRIVPDNPVVTGDYARTVEFTYDLLGKPLSTSADGQSITYAYDSAGRIDTITDVYNGNSYLIDHTYDEADNRIGTTWPGGGSLVYTYDALNRMDLVTSNVPGLSLVNLQLADYDYNSRSDVELVSFGNGTTSDPDYYPNETLRRLLSSIPGRSLNVVMGRNRSDEITSIDLTVTNPSSQWSETLFAWRPTDNSDVAYVPNKLNRYATVGSANYEYDANGNLTSDGSWTFVYDEENRLRRASGASKPTVTYEYDPLGRRRAKTVDGVKTIYLSDGDEEVEERDGANAVLRRYAYGSALDERIAMIDPAACAGGGRCFYLANHQLSTLVLTNQDGSINQTYGYDPYGNPAVTVPGIPTTGNPFRFTGRRLDPETNLYYFRARYYSPSIGRFLQTDPMGSKDDLNLYSYGFNDPLNNKDPKGTEVMPDPDTARAKYGKGTRGLGHHFVSFEATVMHWYYENDPKQTLHPMDLSSDARRVFGGKQGVNGVPLPHKIHPGRHAKYSMAVAQELLDFASERGIKLEKMTTTQALEFLHHIKTMQTGIIGDMNARIMKYTSMVLKYGAKSAKVLRYLESLGVVALALQFNSVENDTCSMVAFCRQMVQNRDEEPEEYDEDTAPALPPIPERDPH